MISIGGCPDFTNFSANERFAVGCNSPGSGTANRDDFVANPDLTVEEAKAIIVFFCSMPDERQRRLFVGLESLKLGRGGHS